MLSEAELKEKLRKIQALHAKATTNGERDAASAARERLREYAARTGEKVVPIKCHLKDRWMTALFLALARKHGLTPYRRWGQHYSTVMVDVPRNVLDHVLWPEFQALWSELETYLHAATDRIIRESVHQDISDAAIRGELTQA